ncbi:hypothetical protein [Streptomyces sp. AcE210]|nr:hypothetical protein [Streptomyces sp. AcE210]
MATLREPTVNAGIGALETAGKAIDGASGERPSATVDPPSRTTGN